MRERLEEGVRRGAEGEVLDLELGEAVGLGGPPRAGPGEESASRLRAATCASEPPRAPAIVRTVRQRGAVVRELHVVARGMRRPRASARSARRTRAGLLEIDRERSARRPSPASLFHAVVTEPSIASAGSAPGARGRRRHGRRRQAGGGLIGKLAQGEPAHLHRPPPAATTGRHHELDGRRVPQDAILGRSPREVDLALLDPDLLPFARKLEVGPAEPPDVVAARVDELDLELVGRRVAPNVEEIS